MAFTFVFFRPDITQMLTLGKGLHKKTRIRRQTENIWPLCNPSPWPAVASLPPRLSRSHNDIFEFVLFYKKFSAEIVEFPRNKFRACFDTWSANPAPPCTTDATSQPETHGKYED